MYICQFVDGFFEGYNFEQNVAVSSKYRNDYDVFNNFFFQKTYPLGYRAMDGVNMGIPIHLAQMLQSKKLTQFDYGPERNLKIYGQMDPPSYNPKNISVPLEFYIGQNDLLVTEKV